jgi:putative membrane protein
MCCVQTTFQKCNTGVRKSFLQSTVPWKNMNNRISPSRQQTILSLAAIVLIAILIASGLHPYDRATWLMEVLPVLIALPILAWSYRRFPLTNLLYFLIFLHALILIGGGTYTYARVPFGFWLQDILSSARNPYDKIGHFAQGLIPALVAKEILWRGGYVATPVGKQVGGKMVAFISICIAMAISAWYELIEWWAALIMGQGADEFLGTQGDQWDTQSDMFMAFIGSTVAMVLLARWHNRQIVALQARNVRNC